MTSAPTVRHTLKQLLDRPSTVPVVLCTTLVLTLLASLMLYRGQQQQAVAEFQFLAQQQQQQILTRLNAYQQLLQGGVALFDSSEDVTRSEWQAYAKSQRITETLPGLQAFGFYQRIERVSVATTRNWKDKNSGDKVEETEWHRVVFYDRLAEIAGEYLKKGRPVYVEGRLKTRKWQDKDGKDNYTTEIVAEQMQLLGGREGGGGGGYGGGQGGPEDYSQEAPSAPSRPAARPAPAPAPRPAPKSSTGFDDMDDDIPF